MKQNCKAFTLVEMSIVLIVIGLVIVIVFPALQAMRLANQQSLTTTNLQTLMRATAAFTQANGCVPCPTPADKSGSNLGWVRGVNGGAACGACSQPEGVPPYISLGLPAAAAKDGWGRWITMRVDPALAINFGVAPPTSPCLASDPAPCTLGMSQKGMCRASLSKTNSPTITTVSGGKQYTAVILLSHGPNGSGAFQANVQSGLGTATHPVFDGPACATDSGFEHCNADSDTSFVEAMRTESSADPFDDLMLYLDRNALVSYLGNVACQTSW